MAVESYSILTKSFHPNQVLIGSKSSFFSKRIKKIKLFFLLYDLLYEDLLYDFNPVNLVKVSKFNIRKSKILILNCYISKFNFKYPKRECKLFYVRSVKTIKIPDKSLLKWLGIILLIGTIFLVAWSFRKYESPREQLRYDPAGLKYETCTITEWNFVSMASKLKQKSFFFAHFSFLNFSN